MFKPKARSRDLPLELTAEDVLTNLFDSDTWTPGLVEADPAEAARFICDWLRSSGVAIVDQERLKAGLVDAVFDAARALAKT
jgi:hypothetical protein